ncbi:MAG: hypothetical protein ACK5M0_01735 [Bacteroidales bacterium]
MKIRLSTKLFIVGVAIVIIAAISVAIYNVKNNPESFIETSKDKNNYNNSTITIEKYEITEDEISE